MPVRALTVRFAAFAALLLASCSTPSLVFAAEPSLAEFEKSFQPEIVPLLKKLCHDCHGPDLAEAELDLAAMASFGDVRKHAQAWQRVAEMLDTEQMPPKDADHPTAAERAALQRWVKGYLTVEAQARAGDPGKVVLRRLSNAEYTYTIRDLTGVDSLSPAREFPVDGAAGEGFTNTGNALVMSPALVTKYLDAAKSISQHAVLLPDGFRFAPSTTPRDWTDEILAEIRGIYRPYTDVQQGRRNNLQGEIFDINEGGRIPLDRYLAATVRHRTALEQAATTTDAIAKQENLNPKYLRIVWASLNDPQPSLLLQSIQSRWRKATPDDIPALVDHITAWQNGLSKFSAVGHIGKVGGPKRWLEPVNPIVNRQELRYTFPYGSTDEMVTISLVATDAGDGGEQDNVVWQQPRLVAPGRPDLLLRDVRAVTRAIAARRVRMIATAAQSLAAAHEAASSTSAIDAVDLANRHNLPPDDLKAWLNYLGIGASSRVDLKGHFTEKLTSAAGHEFIQGWGSHDTPLIVANASDTHVRIPGNLMPRSVAVHPSIPLQAAVGWRSPESTVVRLEGLVQHAHPECGSGVSWSLELRRGDTRRQLASGVAQGGGEVKFGPIDSLAIQAGDLVSLLIGPRDNNHSCDLTRVELQLTGATGRVWNLATDVSGNILAANPHADVFGNEEVWHFYTEPVGTAKEAAPAIPAGSILARWQAAKEAAERSELAEQLQALLTAAPPDDAASPDAQLYRQMTSPGGPLLSAISTVPTAEPEGIADGNSPQPGLDPAMFGKSPTGGADSSIGDDSLCVKAPSVIQFQLPRELAAGCELVATGVMHKSAGSEGSVQLQIVAGKASQSSGLLLSEEIVVAPGGRRTADPRITVSSAPVLVNQDGQAQRRYEQAFDDFRNLFPAALCYTKIVPVDEVVTLILFHREDDHLVRLMLDDAQSQRLERLWDELRYVSRDAITLVDAYAQLMEYATQDADPKVFAPLREPINARAEAFKKRLVETEPNHLESLLQFANRAYRRPLTDNETSDLKNLYASLRQEELPHEEAFRLTLARVLVAPAFLYRIEKPVPGNTRGPVSDWELASRLSYFFWSSQPDEELQRLAAAGQLHDPQVLTAQARRMLQDAKARRMATEFACQWLHIYDFDQLDEKSEQHFPTFNALRGHMYEESIQFFTHLLASNGSVLDILNADYTFLNEELAAHYGIPDVKGPEWRRVDGVKRYSYGGILGQSTTLAKQSGASRTSPILRGNWVSEVLLGERLPRPPKGIPQLPEDETATAGLTVRQLVEKHVSDQKCAVCHQRIDPLGFALEEFDAIGRHRKKDLADRPIDVQAKAMDGAEFGGLDGLRNYLLTARRDAFVRQFCRKLLGYSLGRSVQLSDEPLLTEMQQNLKANDYKITTAVDTIILSPQFREIRGRELALED